MMNLGEGQRWGPITYAQHGDDLFIINLFELMGIDKPSYLDIGANHPFAISNTALLYQRGSRGVNVEANPELIEAFLRDRPLDINVNIGVAPGVGKLQFFMFRDGNGLNTFSQSERDRTIASGNPMTRSMMIDVIELNDVVKQHCNGEWPDFLNMDVEGLDYDVLKATCFDGGPDVICVETRKHETQKMRAMMATKDYGCAARLGENLIFIKNSMACYL